MKRHKVSENFYLDEFINPETYNKFGVKSSRYINPMVVNIAQLFRDLAKQSVTINNWATGGSYKESGLRDFNTSTGAKYSMHKFGGSIDIKCGSMSSWGMYDLVTQNWAYFYELGARRVEHPDYTKGNNRDWLHIDTANDLTHDNEQPNIIIP